MPASPQRGGCRRPERRTKAEREIPGKPIGRRHCGRLPPPSIVRRISVRTLATSSSSLCASASRQAASTRPSGCHARPATWRAARRRVSLRDRCHWVVSGGSLIVISWVSAGGAGERSSAMRRASLTVSTWPLASTRQPPCERRSTAAGSGADPDLLAVRQRWDSGRRSSGISRLRSCRQADRSRPQKPRNTARGRHAARRRIRRRSSAAGICYSPRHAALSRASRPLPFRSASARADTAAIASAACNASCACGGPDRPPLPRRRAASASRPCPPLPVPCPARPDRLVHRPPPPLVAPRWRQQVGPASH